MDRAPVDRAPGDRAPGPSVRLRLTLSYAGFLLLAGVLLLAVVWVFLLRYVPDGVIVVGDVRGEGPGLFVPNRSDLQRAFLPRAAAALAVLLVLGLVGGWFLAGRVLAPLTHITDATRTAATGSLSHRIRLPGRRDEFRELADAFDGMLARLEAHVAEQRRFAANASHELRTPLAVTRTLLEVAREDPERDVDLLVENLLAVTGRAADLTEALLLLGRAEQRPAVPERVDLSLLAEEAAETLLPLAEEHGITLRTTGEPAPASGSRALLQQLVTNLLHNAVVHNAGPGGMVELRTAAGPGTSVLTVENTGEVLAPERVATFTEPFVRGTERVHASQAGAGLGLAIVAGIVQAHDATLEVVARPGGGLVVTVRLPVPSGGCPTSSRP